MKTQPGHLTLIWQNSQRVDIMINDFDLQKKDNGLQQNFKKEEVYEDAEIK